MAGHFTLSFYNRDKNTLDKSKKLKYNATRALKALLFANIMLFYCHDKRGGRMKLGDIATVRSGLVLSRKQSREPSGIRYPLLNLRSINPRGYIDLEQTDVFDAVEQLAPEYLSQVGDVVVRLSVPYTAVLIDEMTEGMVISSNFVIIRTDRRTILPEYLFWLINTPKVKRSIYENTGGNMLGAIKAKYFAEFEISALPISDQQKIGDMNDLSMKETKLLRQLADEKELYYSLMIERANKEMKRGNKA